jgi:hypothetical protein
MHVTLLRTSSVRFRMLNCVPTLCVIFLDNFSLFQYILYSEFRTAVSYDKFTSSAWPNGKSSTANPMASKLKPAYS